MPEVAPRSSRTGCVAATMAPPQLARSTRWPATRQAPSARLAALAGLALAALLLAGCATVPPNAGSNPADPFEKVNRQVDAFNFQLDRAVLKPVAKAYVSVVPDPARRCVSNFFSNLGELPTALNNLLQGKPAAAASDTCRFVLNSTVGVLGCFDVASTMGLARSNEDFGQTLGRWGAGPGPYIVLPLFGPSDVRDAFGKVADIEADPLGYARPVKIIYIATPVKLVDTRASLLQAEDVIEGAALDRYSFTRDAYLQRRRYLVYDGNPPPLKDQDDDGTGPDQPAPAPAPGPDQPPAGPPR